MLLPLLASGGMSLLGGLFGGRKQETSYKMSPEERSLYAQLMGQVKEGGAPSYLTRPIAQRWGARRAGIRERVGEGLGPGSGLETAHLLRATTAEGREMGEATERHKQGLLNILAGLAGGRGTRTTQAPTDWGGIFGGMGEDIGFLWGLKQMMGGGQAGGGGGRSGGGMRFQPGFLGGR